MRILLVEDSADDALLMELELRRFGLSPEINRVDSRESLLQSLNHAKWDVVITDHNLPDCSSEITLSAVHDAGLDVPVIIVSGSIGEDIAVAAMKLGASDYIMKSNLLRLGPAIERELREAAIRRDHRQAEATIRHMAFHDPLTGLYNRHKFERHLATALESLIEEGIQHALLYLDLDQFKLVNDTCGHVAGDELLKQLAFLLQNNVRDSDVLARLGGDEFGLLLENCPVEQAENIANKILKAINDFRFVWSGKTFTVGGSIGLVPMASATISQSDLLRTADIACYAAKDHGRNRIHIYSDNDIDLIRRQGEMLWVTRIGAALEEDRFTLYQQDIVPLNGHRDPIKCCEILLRLRDEQSQIVHPGAFLPAAERYSLAPMIDRWVVQRLLAKIRDAKQVGTYIPTQYFINISGMTLNDDGFFSFIHQQLRETGLSAANFCFEITETAAIANLSRAVEFIDNFRHDGCHFALDDFGAGLSSFSYLKTIPVDYLKIDGSFVRDILQDPMDRAIVESVNHIGHVVGLKTIAEYVESEAIRQVLDEMKVDYAQGFGLHYPEPLHVKATPMA